MSAEIPHRMHSVRSAGLPPSFPAGPVCRSCGSDAHLSYESFVPARFNPGIDRMLPSVVNYTCRRCGKYHTQQAPEGWAPPGWQWYD